MKRKKTDYTLLMASILGSILLTPLLLMQERQWKHGSMNAQLTDCGIHGCAHNKNNTKKNNQETDGRNTPKENAAKDDARCVRLPFDINLPAGETSFVRLTFTNIGQATWTPGSYVLSASNSRSGDNLFPAQERMQLLEQIAPQKNGYFDISILVPRQKGRYRVTGKMTHENRQFGEECSLVINAI